MKQSDHSLCQVDSTFLDRRDDEALRLLFVKLLVDPKEARERLNQNSCNSSRPPSSQASKERLAEEPAKAMKDKPKDKAASEAEADAGADKEEASKENSGQTCQFESPVQAVRRAGKVEGTTGYGPKAPVHIDSIELYAATGSTGCGLSPQVRPSTANTGHYEGTDRGGWQTYSIKHLWQEAACDCGHLTRAKSPRRAEDGAEVGGDWTRLAALIVALSMLLIERIRIFRARCQAMRASAKRRGSWPVNASMTGTQFLRCSSIRVGH